MFLDDLNKLINNSFAYSNVNTTDLKSIDGKSLKIDLLNTNTVIFIEINNEKILLKDEIENEPSITILATPINLLSYIKNPDNENEIKIMGDIKTAEKIFKIFQGINFDFTSVLASYINQDLAYYMSKSFQHIAESKKYARESFQRNIEEYIKEDQDLLVQKEVFDEFSNSIVKLRNKIDFMEKKIKSFS